MAGVLGESQRSTCSSSGSALTGQGWPLRKNNGSAPNNSSCMARSRLRSSKPSRQPSAEQARLNSAISSTLAGTLPPWP